MKRIRKLNGEDWLLVLLSGLMFAVLYLMINPGVIVNLFNAGSGAFLVVHKAILGSVIWSVIIGYFVLHVLRLSSNADTKKLYDYLGLLLCALAFLFILAAFGVALGQTIESFTALRADNTGNEASLVMSYIFLSLRFLVDITPFIMNLVTVFLGLKLLEVMKADRYSEETLSSAEKLSLWCKKTLSTVVITNIALNVLQLLFTGSLRDINSSVSIPVTSICFVIVVLLFSRMIAETRKLKKDNDLFI